MPSLPPGDLLGSYPLNIIILHAGLYQCNLQTRLSRLESSGSIVIYGEEIKTGFISEAEASHFRPPADIFGGADTHV